MKEQKIEPHRITKPFQLLAAWLVGLMLINGSFLISAISISIGWLKASLIIASIVNIPLFLISIFILQTKFRPEMQEDFYYSEYLDKKSQKIVTIPRLPELKRQMPSIITEEKFPEKKKSTCIDKILYSIAINDHLPNFREIRQELRKENFKVTEIFGKIDGTYKPDKFIISMSDKISDIVFIKEFLNILFKYEFHGIVFAKPDPFLFEKDVYIGSYDYKEAGYVKITKELKKLVKDDIEMVDFEYYIKSNTSNKKS